MNRQLFGTLSAITVLAVAAVCGAPATAETALPKNIENHIYNVAYFDDGSDKQSIVSLREKDARGEPLSDEEEAILQAANRVGWIYWPECKLGGNAFLIQIGDKDAVITSAHQVLEPKTGETKKSCSDENIKRSEYYPDGSYIDTRGGKPSEDSFVWRKVASEYRYPYNFERRLGHGLFDNSDWLIIPLASNILEEIAPDGRRRGFLRRARNPDGTPQVGYMIGFDPRFDKQNGGKILSYQKCDMVEVETGAIAQSCDSAFGSSSSLLGVLEKGEIRFIAVHRRTNYMRVDDDEDYPLPDDPDGWNMGVSVRAIAMELERQQVRLKIAD